MSSNPNPSRETVPLKVLNRTSVVEFIATVLTLPEFKLFYKLRQLSGFESRHLSKIINGRHKQKSEQHTPTRHINIQTKYIFFAIYALRNRMDGLVSVLPLSGLFLADLNSCLRAQISLFLAVSLLEPEFLNL
jgi:hypothetical protein